MRRGEIWRYDAVIARAGQSDLRLIVSADAVNASDALPAVYGMHVVTDDPGSLLAVRLDPHGWAFALQIDRPVRKRLVERVGVASPAEMEQVDNAIRAVYDV
ncbi:MAG: type II toxin-antitoxin system PemK/MazF family toxin [Pseudonocardia sp.]